jgi:dCMP deaminase
MTTTRPTWEEFFRDIALCTAQRSSCTRLKVGCILVKDNRIISQGYNGFLSGHPHKSIVVHDHEMATIHAEQNAIIDCAKRGVSCNHAHAYVTHYPCIVCLKMLVQSGIEKVYYIHDYKNEENLIQQLDINIPITKLKMPDETK